MTKEQLKACMPAATNANIEKYLQPLNEAMEMFQINTPRRQSAFIAQLAHESGSFRYVLELASGEAYEGRKDLGNTQPGDGVKFKGRGLIQITGRTNYKEVGKALGWDFINHPEDLEKPGAASYSAAWFWNKKGLNKWADASNFQEITRRINGGYTHYKERHDNWIRCQKALGLKEINYDERK